MSNFKIECPGKEVLMTCNNVKAALRTEYPGVEFLVTVAVSDPEPYPGPSRPKATKPAEKSYAKD